jgi:ankyrin repeat protein
LATVKELLDCGANVHARDKNGWTAWLWAFSAGHADVVKLLEARGAEY